MPRVLANRRNRLKNVGVWIMAQAVLGVTVAFMRSMNALRMRRTASAGGTCQPSAALMIALWVSGGRSRMVISRVSAMVLCEVDFLGMLWSGFWLAIPLLSHSAFRGYGKSY